MGLQSRAAVGLLKESLPPANLSLRQNQPDRLNRAGCRPSGGVLLAADSLTASGNIRDSCHRKAVRTTGSRFDWRGGTSSAAPCAGNFTQPRQVGHARTLAVCAREPPGTQSFDRIDHFSTGLTEDAGRAAHDHQQDRSRGCNHEPPCRRECHGDFQKSLSDAPGSIVCRAPRTLD